MATDRAKDSSTPLTAGLDVTSQELLTLYITQNKHQDVLEGAQYIEQNPQKTLSPCPSFSTRLLYLSLVHLIQSVPLY